MSFVAKGGRVVTDDMLDKWADDADNGEFRRKAGVRCIPGLSFLSLRRMLSVGRFR